MPEYAMLECPYCHITTPPGHLTDHIMTCWAAAQYWSTPQLAVIAKYLLNNPTARVSADASKERKE